MTSISKLRLLALLLALLLVLPLGTLGGKIKSHRTAVMSLDTTLDAASTLTKRNAKLLVPRHIAIIKSPNTLIEIVSEAIRTGGASLLKNQNARALFLDYEHLIPAVILSMASTFGRMHYQTKPLEGATADIKRIVNLLSDPINWIKGTLLRAFKGLKMRRRAWLYLHEDGSDDLIEMVNDGQRSEYCANLKNSGRILTRFAGTIGYTMVITAEYLGGPHRPINHVGAASFNPPPPQDLYLQIQCLYQALLALEARAFPMENPPVGSFIDIAKRLVDEVYTHMDSETDKLSNLLRDAKGFPFTLGEGALYFDRILNSIREARFPEPQRLWTSTKYEAIMELAAGIDTVFYHLYHGDGKMVDPFYTPTLALVQSLFERGPNEIKHAGATDYLFRGIPRTPCPIIYALV